MDATTRGTLYQVNHVLAGSNNTRFERFLLFKWVDQTGTFDELVAAIPGGDAYKLEWSEKWLRQGGDQDVRTGFPGWTLVGYEWPGQSDQQRLLGIFVPEGKEEEVKESPKHDLGSIVFIPLTLEQLELALAPMLTPA